MNNDAPSNQKRKQQAAAAGGVVGALLVSSCCIGPLLLIMLGASGAWIGSLSALKAYQPVFVTLAAGFLAFGFWQVYGKAQRSCEEESCSTPGSDRIVKVVLWTATVLVLISLTTDLWAPLFY
ncbi:MAG: mercuric transporter MerT family protein [Gammaproteobacteria bacterium]|nr:mercuric transporter MerT family protein [Gammaproteobacteria bacterium]